MSVITQAILAPLARFYADPATVEIRMNRPHAVVTERRGEGKRRVEAPHLNRAAVERIARSLGNHAGVAFDGEDRTKLSCVLPGGHRFECLVGASVLNPKFVTLFGKRWTNFGFNQDTRIFIF